MTADTPTPDERPRNSAAAAAPLALGPLQSVTVHETGTTLLETGILLALVAVGALLTYQASRGARRNDDRSMALFGAGLFLLTVGHAGLKLLAGLGGESIALGAAAVSQLIDLTGLGLVFYAVLR